MGEGGRAAGQGQKVESEKICSLFCLRSSNRLTQLDDHRPDDRENQFPYERPYIVFAARRFRYFDVRYFANSSALIYLKRGLKDSELGC